MKSLTAIGVLGHNISLQTTKMGTALYKFSVGVSTGKDKAGNYKPTFWVNCTMSQEYGAKIADFMIKGSKVYISGNPTLNVYSTKSGEPAASLEVWCNAVELVSGKKDLAEGVQDDGVSETMTLPDTPVTELTSDTIPF